MSWKQSIGCIVCVHQLQPLVLSRSILAQAQQRGILNQGALYYPPASSTSIVAVFNTVHPHTHRYKAGHDRGCA
jgi:hypothetical protein